MKREDVKDFMQILLFFIGAILCLFLLCTYPVSAQTLEKNGIVLKSNTESRKDTLVTIYRFEDSKGLQYPIILNKKNGKFYIWRRSTKTGKMYPYYFPPKKQEEMRVLIGI